MNTMTSPTEKGISLLKHFYQTFTQPESLRSFENSFLIEYKSSNPLTNSKKKIQKIYTTSAIHSTSLCESSEPLSLRYGEKPSRVEVVGSWESWVVDEKVHEGLMQDCIFGRGEQSRDGAAWVYVAKVKPPKTQSLWCGGEGNREYIHDYGQGYTARTHNGIFVRNLRQQRTYSIHNKENLLMAAPIFLTSDGSKIMFHAYNLQQSEGLSCIHNFNRKISLYTATLAEEEYVVERVESEEETNIFPALSKCGNYLAYFSGTGITNCFYMDIVIMERGREGWREYHKLKQFFVGSYMRCKIHFYEQAGNPFFLVETNENSSNAIYSFDLVEKQLFRFTENSSQENHTIQSFNSETNLLVTHYSNANTISLAYSYLPDPLTIIPSTFTFDYSSNYSTEPIPHFVLTKGSSDEKKPLVVLIHGGPHVSADPGLTPFKYLLLEAGYTVLIPNYSGSIGYGKEYLERALGKLGDVEDEEISQCVEKLINENKVDPSRIYSYGVCYGGFLSAILASKFSHIFTGSIMLNPIISLSHMLYSSDISDWVFTEGLNKENKISPLTEYQNSQIFHLSPVNNLPNIPVIVFAGGKDRRVNPDATKHYITLTKNKGIKCELYLYPESDHKLSDSLESFTDIMLKSFRFIEETRK